MTEGVFRSIDKLRPDDQFRVITFSDRTRALTGGWKQATPDEVARAITAVESLQRRGSTNLYDEIKLAVKDLNDDRATSVMLVTDAVTNRGIVDTKQFHKLMRQYDIRVFGFLMGNGANRPLMRTICDASGRFYSEVSNAADIIGRIILAKDKITHECLHDAQLSICGVKTFDTTREMIGKVYLGEQLAIFGHYQAPGQAEVSLNARLTGEDKVQLQSPVLGYRGVHNAGSHLRAQEPQSLLLVPDNLIADDLGSSLDLTTRHATLPRSIWN